MVVKDTPSADISEQAAEPSMSQSAATAERLTHTHYTMTRQ